MTNDKFLQFLSFAKIFPTDSTTFPQSSRTFSTEAEEFSTGFNGYISSLCATGDFVAKYAPISKKPTFCKDG